MEPYKAKELPFEYNLDKEMFILVAEANAKYGEYKSLLNTLEFDSAYFLESVLLKESYKSTQIEETQITQEELYYLKYMEVNDDSKEIENLKNTIEYAENKLKQENIISYELVNKMHQLILDSVRGSKKSLGEIRTTQNWIGPRGCTQENATFIPPKPKRLMDYWKIYISI